MPDVSKFRDTWRNLGARGQLGLVASALLVLVTLFMLFHYAGKPSYTTLYSGIDAAQTNDISKALDAAGVKYKIGNGGTEIAVAAGSESDARMALAAKGLPNGGHQGFELFDKNKLGATDFQQKVQYQRALEGEIARTIEQIEGVRSAQVQLVMPEESLFASDGTKASAAVLVVGGSSLDEGTVRGIAHMVSSSVKDLNAQDVTITDETGAMLWPTGDGTPGAGPATKLQAEQRYDAQLSSQINSFLATTLGVGKAQVRIKSDLNVNQGTVDQITYDNKGVVDSISTDKEGLKSKGAATTGAAGVASNVPGYSTGSSTPGSSNYDHVKNQTNFLHNKKIERTIIAPGAVNRLDVALMVDSSVPKAELASLQKTVAAMAGVNTTRGDTLAVSTLQFAAPPTAAVAPKAGLPIPPAFAGMLKWVGLGFVLLICTFLMRRNLKRREGEGVAVEPTWLREIEGAVPIAELEAGTHHAFQNDPAVDRRAAIKAEVEDLAKKEPGQLAMQVTQWMKEG